MFLWFNMLLSVFRVYRQEQQLLNLFFRYIMIIFLHSRDSVVGIATSYGLDDRGVGVRVPVGSRIFTSLNRPDWL
jgi:hypothetical protein